MTVISIDPGRHIGVACWRENGKLEWKANVSVEDFLQFLATFQHKELSAFVVEDWRLRTRQGQQTGSKMEASQVIGAVRLFCVMHGIKLVMQDPSVMRITAMHFDISLPKGHIADDIAAMLHGYRYFEVIGVLKPLLQR